MLQRERMLEMIAGMGSLEILKKLRAETGAGLDMCSSALKEAEGDYAKAIEVLKAKGLEKAAKKINNFTKMGSIVVKQNENRTVLLNFRAETDFAVNGEGFCDFVTKEAEALLNSDLDNIKNLVIEGASFNDRLAVYASVLGENITLNECEVYSNQEMQNIVYLHKKIRKGYDDIASLVVVLQVSKSSPRDLAESIALHIAASDSLVLSSNDITEEMRAEHDNIEDLVLLNQPCFHDNSLSVKEFANQHNIEIISFKVFAA